MITKYEKRTETLNVGTGTTDVSYDEVTVAKDATHIHYCGHDTDPPTPCRRVAK